MPQERRQIQQIKKSVLPKTAKKHALKKNVVKNNKNLKKRGVSSILIKKKIAKKVSAANLNEKLFHSIQKDPGKTPLESITTIDLSGSVSFQEQDIPSSFNPNVPESAFSSDIRYNEEEVKSSIVVYPPVRDFVKNVGNIKQEPVNVLGKEQKKVENSDVKTEIIGEDIFAPPNYWEIPGFIIPKRFPKTLAVFFSFCLLLIIPIYFATFYNSLTNKREAILSRSKEAISYLQKGKDSAAKMDLTDAKQNFLNAQEKFNAAKNEYESIGFLTKAMVKIIPGERQKVQAGESMLFAGSGLAGIGYDLTESLSILIEDSSANTSFIDTLAEINTKISLVLPKIARAENLLDGSVNKGESETLQNALQGMPKIRGVLEEFSALTESILKVSGQKGWTRNLLVFQNNNEIRPTGGFIGGFAIVDLEDGKIKKIEIPGGGGYDVQGSLRSLSAAPHYLLPANTRLNFHDANIFFDFPKTAEKLNKTLESARWPSVDNVLAVNASFMESLLELLGPIAMPEYGKTFTAANFVEEMTRSVELEYDKEENKPKKIVGDMFPKIIDAVKLLDKENVLKMGALLLDGLKSKDIMLYSFDTQIQNVISSLGWSGEIKDVGYGEDYLAVVRTNIGGEKSDCKITERITQETFFKSEGTVNKITLRRKHNGLPGEEFVGVPNRVYLRMYIPKGSVLLSAENFESPDENHYNFSLPGFTADEDISQSETGHFFDSPTGIEIYDEGNKTVFAGWVITQPGEEKEVSIQYQLPFSSNQEGFYSMFIQKQSGVNNVSYESIIYAKTLQKMYPTDMSIKNGDVFFQSTLLQDEFFGIVF